MGLAEMGSNIAGVFKFLWILLVASCIYFVAAFRFLFLPNCCRAKADLAGK